MNEELLKELNLAIRWARVAIVLSMLGYVLKIISYFM